MYISSTDWTAQNDRMPGCASLRVNGIVEVATGGITATLVKPETQDKSLALRLDLVLERQSNLATTAHKKLPVSFKLAGNHRHIPKVDIYYENQRLTTITDILVTD